MKYELVKKFYGRGLAYAYNNYENGDTYLDDKDAEIFAENHKEEILALKPELKQFYSEWFFCTDVTEDIERRLKNIGHVQMFRDIVFMFFTDFEAYTRKIIFDFGQNMLED